MCDPHKAHNHHAQGYSVSQSYLWRASSLLRSSSSLKSVSVFLLVVGYVGDPIGTREGNVTGDNIVQSIKGFLFIIISQFILK